MSWRILRKSGRIVVHFVGFDGGRKFGQHWRAHAACDVLGRCSSVITVVDRNETSS